MVAWYAPARDKDVAGILLPGVQPNSTFYPQELPPHVNRIFDTFFPLCVFPQSDWRMGGSFFPLIRASVCRAGFSSASTIERR
jgi:hypothetical protein